MLTAAGAIPALQRSRCAGQLVKAGLEAHLFLVAGCMGGTEGAGTGGAGTWLPGTRGLTGIGPRWIAGAGEGAPVEGHRAGVD